MTTHLVSLSAGAIRRARLSDARLYLVTDARTRQGDLEAFLDRILEAGVDIVQLREKHAEAGDLIRWGRIFKRAADRFGALFLVNDRPDVAIAVEADGVHLGQNDLPVGVARRMLGEDMLIGLSTHAEREFWQVPVDADYMCAGPVFETPTKPGRPASGHSLVRFAAEQMRIETTPRPWFAIGGIDATTLPEVVAAGAARVVVVRAIAEAGDPAAAVRELLAKLPPIS